MIFTFFIPSFKGYFVIEGKMYCETHARRHAQPPGPDMVAVPVYR